MKFAKLFAAFLLINGAVWIGTHFYLQKNNSTILLVIDTSHSMKKKFIEVKDWIENYERTSRYKTITVGTDKALLGKLSDLASKEVIFRTSFGKLQQDNLIRLYSHTRSDQKILLSDGSLKPEGWEVIEF